MPYVPLATHLFLVLNLLHTSLIILLVRSGQEDFDDYDLLRFCRARKFVIGDVTLMFGNFIDWREENGVNSIIWDYKFTEK